MVMGEKVSRILQETVRLTGHLTRSALRENSCLLLYGDTNFVGSDCRNRACTLRGNSHHLQYLIHSEMLECTKNINCMTLETWIEIYIQGMLWASHQRQLITKPGGMIFKPNCFDSFSLYCSLYGVLIVSRTFVHPPRWNEPVYGRHQHVLPAYVPFVYTLHNLIFIIS